MLFNLISSIAVATACGMPMLRSNMNEYRDTDNEVVVIDEPQRAYTAYTLSGGYCIRNADEYGQFFTGQLFNNNVNLDIVSNSAQGNPYTVFVTDCRGTLDLRFVGEQFYLYYDSQNNNISFYCEFAEDGTTELSFTLVSGDDITDVSIDNAHSLGVYFTNAMYVTAEQYNLFNTIFTKQISSYFFTYNGWYTIDSHVPTSNVQSCTFNCYCIFDNYIYNNFRATYTQSGSQNVYYNYTLLNWNNNAIVNDFDILYQGQLMTDHLTIYIQDLFCTRHSYIGLLNIGYFSYTRPVTDYSLTDLFYNIADTPVIFFTSMFDFELLGMNFSFAFFGILTVCAMVFVIKKVV